MPSFTLAHLIAIGPVPRRYIRDTDELLRLATDDDGILHETGTYELLDADSDA